MSLWYLMLNGNVLRCADRFEGETSRHTSGFESHRSEFPEFFAQLDAGSNGCCGVRVARAPAEFYRALMAFSTVPLRRHARVVGVIGPGNPADITGVRNLLWVLASVAALRATDDVETSDEAVPKAIPVKGAAEPVRSLSADLTRYRRYSFG